MLQDLDTDRSVKFYAGLPNLLISNIWWARNQAIFNNKDVPPTIIVSITLSQAIAFKEDSGLKNPRIPIRLLLIMRPLGVISMVLARDTPPDAGWGWFFSYPTVTTFISVMPQVPEQTTGLSSSDFGLSLRLQRKKTSKDSRFLVTPSWL
jgi:hypothetical protein